eukprot:3625296-Rhodomonas_salina.1
MSTACQFSGRQSPSPAVPLSSISCNRFPVRCNRHTLIACTVIAATATRELPVTVVLSVAECSQTCFLTPRP